MTGNKSVNIEIRLNAGGTAAGVKRIGDELESTGEKGKRSFAGLESSMTSFQKRVLGLAAAYMSLRGIELVVNKFKEFESVLTDVAKVSDEPLEKVRVKIMSLPETLGNATELMKG